MPPPLNYHLKNAPFFCVRNTLLVALHHVLWVFHTVSCRFKKKQSHGSNGYSLRWLWGSLQSSILTMLPSTPSTPKLALFRGASNPPDVMRFVFRNLGEKIFQNTYGTVSRFLSTIYCKIKSPKMLIQTT